MWELDYKESWVPKNWCFRVVVLEKTLESPLDSKETKPVNPKANQSWIIIGRTDAEAKLQYFDHLMQRANSLEKTLMLAKVESRRRARERKNWLVELECNTDSMDMSLSKLWEMVKEREAQGAAFHGVTKSHTWLSDWTSKLNEGEPHMRIRIVILVTWSRKQQRLIGKNMTQPGG